MACAVLYDMGINDPRTLYHTDDRAAWREIIREWQRFQHHVAYMLSPKQHATQHFTLAELFHAGYATYIVSFNWDDLIEKAYRSQYGEDIPKVTREGEDSDHALWKLHGDIAEPTERWVLPYEEGRVFQAIARRAAQLQVRAFVLGYREQEPKVRDQLIQPLEQRVGVTRIRPDLAEQPPHTLPDNAALAMKKIRAGLEAASQG